MDLETIKGSEKGIKVIEINDDNEQMADISKIHSNNFYGVFPIDFQPLVLKKMMVGHRPRNPIKYGFPFLIKTPYMMCLENEKLTVNLTHVDMDRFKEPHIWLCDSIIMCFLRWMSLQSKKIAVVDSLSHNSLIWDKKLKQNVQNKWGDTPTSSIHKSINSYNLIIFPFCENYHWYAFMFIRLVDRNYILIQFDSMRKKPRTEQCKELIK